MGCDLTVARTLIATPPLQERILHGCSLGALLAVVLVRVVTFNLGVTRDGYVQTNCLAALANMAPAFRKLHPHAARCLVSLVDVLARKHAKLRAASGGDADDEVSAIGDLLRISLEVINVALATALGQNEQLVYALLERQQIFAPLREHEAFAELVGCADAAEPPLLPTRTPRGVTRDTPPTHTRTARGDAARAYLVGTSSACSTTSRATCSARSTRRAPRRGASTRYSRTYARRRAAGTATRRRS